MEDHQNLFQLLLRGGPAELFTILFMIVCTVWLLVSRIRRCFRVYEPRLARDLVFLATGPVCAILLSFWQAAAGTMALMAGGIDAEFGLRYGLEEVVVLADIAFYCFVAGVLGFMLPTKTDGKIT